MNDTRKQITVWNESVKDFLEYTFDLERKYALNHPTEREHELLENKYNYSIHLHHGSQLWEEGYSLSTRYTINPYDIFITDFKYNESDKCFYKISDELKSKPFNVSCFQIEGVVFRGIASLICWEQYDMESFEVWEELSIIEDWETGNLYRYRWIWG